MALRPADEDLVHHTTNEVRVYLDDIADLISNLAGYGQLQIEISHSDGERSLADSLDDLRGRSDVWRVSVAVVDPDDMRLGGPNKPLEVDLGFGANYTVEQGRVDLRRIADHFIGRLERYRRPWWKRVRRRYDLPGVELILEPRANVKEAKARKRHDYAIALVSGLVGALIGAVGTMLGALITGK